VTPKAWSSVHVLADIPQVSASEDMIHIYCLEKVAQCLVYCCKIPLTASYSIVAHRSEKENVNYVLVYNFQTVV